MDYFKCSAGKNRPEDEDTVERFYQSAEKTPCFWCSVGPNRSNDKAAAENFDQAVAKDDGILFDSALSDLMHVRYHQVRRENIAHENAMDILLNAMKAVWLLIPKALSGIGSEIGEAQLSKRVDLEELKRLGIDGSLICRIAYNKVFGIDMKDGKGRRGGTLRRWRSGENILDGKRIDREKDETDDEFNDRRVQRMTVPLDASPPGFSGEEAEQYTVRKELQYERHLHEEVDSFREVQRQQSALQRDLREVIHALPAIIKATTNSVERETLTGILSYAKDCADKGKWPVLTSVGIEIVSHEYDGDLLDEVRLGRCLAPACPLELPEGVRIEPKIYWKTSTQLEAYLHQLPDTTNKWASASQASIHKRVIRIIPILKQHSLLREQLVDQEEL